MKSNDTNKAIRILLIDNYDSFTYNLVQYFREFEGVEVVVRRNDAFTAAEVAAADALVISPGPGLPADAGRLMALLAAEVGRKPVLGICLGMQAIAVHFGGELRNLARVYHGVATEVFRKKRPLSEGGRGCVVLNNLPQTFTAGRYHSWVADAATLPDCLTVTAVDAKGEIMALRHATLPIFGLQFHPESMLTPDGKTMLRNFVKHVLPLEGGRGVEKKMLSTPQPPSRKK